MKKYLIAIAVVTTWAIFSYAYLGVEDGSSGLSALGWIHALFFIPGGILLQTVKGSHSNSDLPGMAVFGWVVYVVATVVVLKTINLIRSVITRTKPNHGLNSGSKMRAEGAAPEAHQP